MSLLVVKDEKAKQAFDQQKQMMVGNRIKLLLKKQVSHSFHNSYEGGKSVAILKIVTSKKEVIKAIQKYLLETFNLVPFDPFSGNHGTGMKCTLLINISELGQEMVKKINDEFSIVYPNTGNKNIVPVIEKKVEVAHKSGSGIVPEYLEQKEVVKERIKRSPADRCRISATALLASAFDFENKFLGTELDYKDLFSYDTEKDNNCQVIRCINEEVAIKVELALCWLSGNGDVVVREVNDIMVNFTKMALTRQNPVNITYCLPPDKHYRVSELEMRLKRACFGSKPVVKIVGIEEPTIIDLNKRYDVFRVLYKKKDTAVKMHNLLLSMGWNCKLTDNGEILISTLPKDESNSLNKEIEVAPKSGSEFVPESLEQKNVIKEIKMKAESRTAGLSQFLHAFLCSDRKINHPSFDSKECHLTHFLAYRKDMIGSSDALNCVDETIAIKVESGIKWLLGSKFVAREGSQVLVDLSEWKDRERRVGSVNFTLPPNQNSSTDEVSKRLSRANITSKPTSVRKEIDMFRVTYHWKTTGGMVRDIISEMGWEAGLDIHGNLLVYVNDIPKPEAHESEEVSQPAEVISQSADKNEKQNEIQKEEAPVVSKHGTFPLVMIEPIEENEKKKNFFNPFGNRKMFASTKVTTPVVLGEEDALYEAKVAELKALRSNTRVFLKLPTEMQEEVNDILFKEEHILDEAMSLLSFFKKK